MCKLVPEFISLFIRQRLSRTVSKEITHAKNTLEKLNVLQYAYKIMAAPNKKKGACGVTFCLEKSFFLGVLSSCLGFVIVGFTTSSLFAGQVMCSFQMTSTNTRSPCTHWLVPFIIYALVQRSPKCSFISTGLCLLSVVLFFLLSLSVPKQTSVN